MPQWKIEIINDSLVVDKQKNIYWRVLIAQGFGKENNEYIILNPIEAAYLLLEKKISCPLTLEELLQLGSKNIPNFISLLLAYTDLRKKRYIVRIIEITDKILFEVYPPNTDIISTQPKFLVHVIMAEKHISIDTLDEILKLAKEKVGKLTLAIVDQDGELVYYDVDTTLKYRILLKLRKDNIVPT